MRYRFRPRLLPTLATLVVVAACLRLGLWQQHKAEAKQALQQQYQQRLQQAPVALPMAVDDPISWRYRRVRVSGCYDPAHQILLDNQVSHETAGYHVLTPLAVTADGPHVLVDRGWIPAPADRRELPHIDTPAGIQHIEGSVWLPGKYYALQEAPEGGGTWQVVWQNLDMARYAKAVPFPVHPLVIRLAPDSDAGGFVRDWPQPAERIAMHTGYAYQWFGFAFAFLVIYIVVNLRKQQPA